MQPIAPAASGHQAAGEGIHDDHFAVLDHIFDVPFIERLGFDCRLNVMLHLPVLGVGNVTDAEQLFDGHPAFIGDANRPLLFIDNVIAGEELLPLG